MIISGKKIEEMYLNARRLADSGHFEAAAGELGEYWNEIGIKPNVESVAEPLKHKLILMSGVLTGWLGSARQIEGSQEAAKDIISESSDYFENHSLTNLWAESRGELALCYWREGAFSEARIILQDALDKLSNNDSELKAMLLLRLVNVEISTYNYENANALLRQTNRLTAQIDSPLLCGKVYFHYALVMRRLAESEDNPERLDESLKYYKLAKKFYRQADHTLYEAMVDNNLGFLYREMREYEKSHLHLDKALKYFTVVKDNARMSLVYDNKAQVLLAENKLDEAEKNARVAVSIIEKGDEHSSLAEYLTTLGRILAVKGDYRTAKEHLLEASRIAYQAGDTENSGLALLTLIENFYDTDFRDDLVEYYLQADEVLRRTTQKTIINRLNRAAKILLQPDKESRDQPKEQTKNKTAAAQFVGESAAAKQILAKAGLFAKAVHPVLISGESGAGKESLARQIYQMSGRADGFTAISCAVFADPKSNIRLLPELFANSEFPNEKSVVETVAGTLCLKDIESLGAADQANLAAYLENTNYAGRKCRLIISTDADLEELTNQKLFRRDLFYRLKTFELCIPPLRDRKEDFRPIAEYLLEKISPQTLNKFGNEVISELDQTAFQGNGDDLKAFVENYVWSRINAVNFEYAVKPKTVKTFEIKSAAEWESFSLPEELRNYEAEIIANALKTTDGKVTAAAALLGLTHQNLSLLLKKRHKDLSAAIKTRKKRTVKGVV